MINLPNFLHAESHVVVVNNVSCEQNNRSNYTYLILQVHASFDNDSTQHSLRSLSVYAAFSELKLYRMASKIQFPECIISPP